MHPADFYTGIVADLYGPLKRFTPDPGPYEEFVRQVGGRVWSWGAVMVIR